MPNDGILKVDVTDFFNGFLRLFDFSSVMFIFMFLYYIFTMNQMTLKKYFERRK